MAKWISSTPDTVDTTNESEFGILLSLVQVLPQLMNQDGVDKVCVTMHLPQRQHPLNVNIDLGTRCNKSVSSLIPSRNGAASLTCDFLPTTSTSKLSRVDQTFQSKGDAKNVIINMLLSSDSQNILSITREEDNFKLMMAGCSYGITFHSSCKDKNCALSVATENTTVRNVLLPYRLCLGCMKVIPELCSLCCDWTTVTMQFLEKGDVQSSLAAFAIGLLTSDNNQLLLNSMIDSVKFSKQLLDNGFPQLTIPLLLAMLKHCVCNMQKRAAYLLLIKAMELTVLNSNLSMLQKLLFQSTCNYLSIVTERDSHSVNSLDLPSIKTSLCVIFNNMLKDKGHDLVKMAVDKFGPESLPFVYILRQLLDAHKSLSHPDLQNKSSSVINFLTGISIIFEDPSVSLDHFAKALWQNPALCREYCRAVSTMISFMFPGLKFGKYSFHLQNEAITSDLPRLAPQDFQLYSLEMRTKDLVTKGEISHSQAAMWYLDLMVNPILVCCNYMKINCLLKSAMHFLQELSNTKLVAEEIALKNAVLTCIYDACQLAGKVHPGMKVFTYQFALETILRLIASVSNKRRTDAILAANIFKNLVYNRQFTSLWRFPADAINVFAAHFIRNVSRFVQNEYLQCLMNLELEQVCPLPPFLLYYYSFENAINDFKHGRETLRSLLEKRIDMMSKFLEEKGLTFEDVTQRMTSPHLPRDDKGWIVPQKSLGQHLQIVHIRGFSFSLSDNSPSIQLLIEPAKDGNGLLSFDDVFTMLQLESNEVFPIRFSLDPPSTPERFHPFHSIRCHPKKLQNTSIMDTLLQTDYLLKSFTTETEASANPPFDLKSVHEGVFKVLPDSLKNVLKSPYHRGYSHMSEMRTWIEAEEILFDEEISAEQNTYYFQRVKLVVRRRPLVRGLNGHCYDAIHSNSIPDAEFAAELTDNYDEISKHLPMFDRLREIVKLQFMMQKTFDCLKSLKTTSPTKYEAFLSELNHLRSLAPIKESQNKCTCIPAVYSFEKHQFVYGGVTLEPTHKRYYGLIGNHHPSSDLHDDVCWVNVHSNHLKPVTCLELEPGGIYFGVVPQYRMPIHVTELENIVCVKLGIASTMDASLNGDQSLASSTTSLSLAISSSEMVNEVPDSLPITKGITEKVASDFVSSDRTLPDMNVGETLHLLSQQLQDGKPATSTDIVDGAVLSVHSGAISEKHDSNSSMGEVQSSYHQDKPVNAESLSDCTHRNLKAEETHENLEADSELSAEDYQESTISSSGSTFAPLYSVHNLPRNSKPTHGDTSVTYEQSASSTQESSSLSRQSGKYEATISVSQSPLQSQIVHSENQQDCNAKSERVTAIPRNQKEDSSCTATSEKVLAIPCNQKEDSSRTATSEKVTIIICDHEDDTSDQSTTLSCKADIDTDATKKGSIGSKDITQSQTQTDSATLVDTTTTLTAEKSSASKVVSSGKVMQSNTQNRHPSTSNQSGLSATSNKHVASSCDNCSTHHINQSAILSSFITSFSESPLNIAVFGEIMHNAGMNISASLVVLDSDMSDFHPNELVREQVKNIVVLNSIIDFCNKQGIKLHAQPE